MPSLFLSAFICVHLRPKMIFSQLLTVVPAIPSDANSFFSLPPQPLAALLPKSPQTRVLNRSHGYPSSNRGQSGQRAEIYRTPLPRGQVRLPLQRTETRHRRRLHRHPRRRSRRLRGPRRPLLPRVPPRIPLRKLPRRHHAPRRLAEAPPPARRGRSPPHSPHRVPWSITRRRTALRLLRRQAPRPSPAPDSRLRTHLVPRQCRDPPGSKAGRGRRWPVFRQLPGPPLRHAGTARPKRIGFEI